MEVFLAPFSPRMKLYNPVCRCAIVRYQRLSDKDILSRLLLVCQAEKVPP